MECYRQQLGGANLCRRQVSRVLGFCWSVVQSQSCPLYFDDRKIDSLCQLMRVWSTGSPGRSPSPPSLAVFLLCQEEHCGSFSCCRRLLRWGRRVQAKQSHGSKLQSPSTSPYLVPHAPRLKTASKKRIIGPLEKKRNGQGQHRSTASCSFHWKKEEGMGNTVVLLHTSSFFYLYWFFELCLIIHII
jgi:hypothetical protein